MVAKSYDHTPAIITCAWNNLINSRNFEGMAFVVKEKRTNSRNISQGWGAYYNE